ncbi:MAG TPA: AAA family ATPase, partial [Streptosporangiaceae bacterium]|nr:AAA family ATPase [Streptosporangiaceae bacterium]
MGVRTMALCGRDAELATVGRVFDGAANGTGQLLLIDGPPGVGKTALMQAARKDAARRGFQVMWARASPSDGVSAFAVVTQLWESLLAEAVPAERAELVGSLRRLAGNELVGSGPAVRLAAAEPAVLYEVLDRLYRSCVRLTRRGPAAIVVDDAQFSDSASSRWLAFLARRIDGLPVALLIAMPLGDLGDEPEPEPATELLSASRMQRVRLAPLDTAASRTLVAGVLGRAPDDAFIAKCQWATGGNPLFLSLLADAAAKQAGHGSRQCDVSALDLGPVAGYVRNQLRRISPEAVPFAEALAVLGHQADLATVAELARLDLGRASRLAGLMNRAGILVSPELAFAHPVVPRAIDADLPRHRRQAIHRETAAVLWRAGESQERVLAHLVTAGPVGEPWAADLLRRAATTALGDNDLGSAVMLLRRLLLEPLDANARTTAAALLDIADTRDGDHGASLRQLAEARDRLPMWGAGIGADLALIQFLAVMERYGDARRVAMQASVRAAAQGQLPALQLRSVVIGLGLCELASAGDALRSLAELEHTQPRLCEDPDTGLGWLRLLRDEWAGLPASHTQTTLHDLAGAGWPSGEAAGGFSVPDFL